MTTGNPPSPDVNKPEKPAEKQKAPDRPDTKQPAAGSAVKNASTGQAAANRGSNTGAQAKTTGKRGRGKAIFLFLLLVVIVGGAYYGWTQYGDFIRSSLPFFVSQESVFNDPASPSEKPVDEAVMMSETVSAGESESSDTKEVRYVGDNDNVESQRIEELASLQDQINELQLTLNSQQKRIRELSTTSREDWLLAEAEYLLRLANQRVLTERQGNNALSLMESADAILRELDDPDLFAVRKALADDITRLRVAGAVDREGIFLKLEALAGVIPRLSLPAVQAAAVQTDLPLDQSLAWYKKMAARAWQALKKLSGIVRVDKVEIASGPLLLPSEQQLLRLNLRQALEQAQLALMREEQVVYSTSLTRATALLDEYFVVDKGTSSAKDELQKLASLQVSRELPTLSPSIKALQDYIALWHNRYRVEDTRAQPSSASEVDIAPEMFNSPPVEVVTEPEYLPENEGDQQ